jgi:hypothetical protein
MQLRAGLYLLSIVKHKLLQVWILQMIFLQALSDRPQTEAGIVAAMANMLRHDVFALGVVARSKAVRDLSNFARMHGMTDSTPERLSVYVIDSLATCQDLSIGTSYGEPVLLKRRRKLLVLNGDRSIVLGGDPSEGEPHGLLRITDDIGNDTINLRDLVTDLDASSSLQLALILEKQHWPAAEFSAETLTNALHFLGAIKGESISSEIAIMLEDLFPEIEATKSEGSLDINQAAVVALEANARTIVTAGPGSGKTHTASARVIKLILDGVPPARIYLITFTRVAAEEIGARVSNAISDVAYGGGVQSMTLDSFAWHFVGTFLEAKASGHHHTIQRARMLLKDGSEEIRERLSRIQHLVIDEAQDVVGERMELVLQLLSTLPDSTGITIFGDWAQAIYGAWAGGSASTASDRKNLHSYLMASDGWQTMELGFNHRTKSPSLRQLFVEARATLSDTSQSAEAKYRAVRTQIEDAATNPAVDLLDPVMPWKQGNLILFRNRATAESASGRLVRAGKTHRLKLSGRAPIVDPMAGALCAGLTSGMTVTREDVSVRLGRLIPAPLDYNLEQAHRLLRRLADSGKSNPVVSKIAFGIERQPLWAVKDHTGSFGPLVGSIHGAKGQEADNVMLMLPSIPTHDDVDWDEEARILFVAATRAARHLHLGYSRPVRSTERQDGSRWLKGGGGGLALSGSDGLLPLSDPEAAMRIWTAAFAQPLCSFVRNHDTAEWRLVLETGDALGVVKPALANNLDFLSSGLPSLPFGGLRVVGATTTVFEQSAGSSPSITLLPVLQGILNGNRSTEVAT